MGALRADGRRERTGGFCNGCGVVVVVAFAFAAFAAAAVVPVLPFFLLSSFSALDAAAGGIVHLSASGTRSCAEPCSSMSSWS